MARVSVVIPAYNAQATLRNAIDSVLGQTLDDLEVFVVDDGSTDGTARLAASYGDPVSCIRTENRGVSEARNTGIRESSGPYVALLDADDLWEPSKLERQLERFEIEQGAGVVTTGLTRVGPDLQALAAVPATETTDACETLLLRSMALGPISSPLIRREVADEVGGFDPALSQCADWDYFLRLSRQTEFNVIPDPLVRYRVSPDSMSSDVARLERETVAVLDDFFAGTVPQRYRALRDRCYSNHWMILSGSYLQAGRRRDALRCLGRGVAAHPPNVRRALGLPVRRLARR